MRRALITAPVAVATCRKAGAFALCAIVLAGINACSAVRVRDMAPHSTVSPAITDGAASSLRAVRLDPARCSTQPRPCLESLDRATDLPDEERLLAMAELQWNQAQAHRRHDPRRVEHCMRTARTAYAALAFTSSRQQEPLRALYNLALECVALQRLVHSHREGTITLGNALPPPWHLRPGRYDLRLPGGARPDEWLSAAHLRMDGIRNDHRRRGVGAAVVAIARSPASEQGMPLRRPRYLPATLVLHFPGATVDDALRGHDVVVDLLDPNTTERVRISGQQDGLHDEAIAADFTAPYALWLSRSRLARQGDRALLRGSDAMAAPQVFAMQPYDPQRRIVVLVHGLGSSPETWANLANDILGDDEVRRRYQLWQVFYPTNLPIAENVRAIRVALIDALDSVDPTRDAPASHGITLVGHSMGGVIARLLAVESGDALWRAFLDGPVDDAERQRLALLEPYLTLAPMPQVRRVILLAAPHRGSPVAGSWLGRSAARLVRLPETLLGRVAEVADALQRDAPEQAQSLRRRQMDSIEALSDQGGYLRATADLPLGPGIAAHSIIGRKDPSVPLLQSSDGWVPYRSAHLDGAISELIVTSGHGVQDTEPAIDEIRRILRESTDDAAVPFPALP